MLSASIPISSPASSSLSLSKTILFSLSFLRFSFIIFLISSFSNPCAFSSALIFFLIAFFSSLVAPSSFATLSAFIFLLNFFSWFFVICFAFPGAFPFCILAKLFGLSNIVFPNLLPTSTAPGLKPNVLFFPGPINNVSVLLFFLETTVWNSVPLDPKVPSGTSTVKLSGFFLLIKPEITFKLPCLTLATIFPSLVFGSYIKVSITTSESDPIVNVDWSSNNICVPDPAPAKIVSFKYILSPGFNSLVSVFTVPEVAPTIPTNCFSIVSSSACEILNIKNKPIITDKIFFISTRYTNF